MSVKSRAFIHEMAFVDPDARIGAGTTVWQFSVVLAGAVIGADCNLNAHTLVEGGAVIGLVTEHLNLDPLAKSALQLIGVYAHNRIRSLMRPQREKPDLLTDREQEVLRWAASGKTSWEISVI